MNPNKPRFTIMFLCTGNSARSIFAEYLLKKIAPVRFETYSAGASPKPAPHPLALEILREDFKIDPSDAYSKSWDEFEDVPFDFVITLCDNAKETCPVWPGQPIRAHWSSPDPAAVEGSDSEKRRAFWQIAQQIRRRLELLASLPFEKLDVGRYTKLRRRGLTAFCSLIRQTWRPKATVGFSAIRLQAPISRGVVIGSKQRCPSLAKAARMR
jgi:arsenate reductase